MKRRRDIMDTLFYRDKDEPLAPSFPNQFILSCVAPAIDDAGTQHPC